MNSKVKFLINDVKFIKETLHDFSAYSLARDITLHMEVLGINQNMLAQRVHVSHTMVAKWLTKGAKPHGKERCKELGMALGMDADELSLFLQKNGYPKLYAKNPMDAACRFILNSSAGDEQVVTAYRDFLKLYGLDSYLLNPNPADIATTVLSRDFSKVESVTGFKAWIKDNDHYFRAFDKVYIATPQLVRFVLLYIGEQTINEMYITGELPITVKNLLYPLLADKEIAVRGLRAKLIVFGLYENMVEDEIDIMLNLARLQPMTEPSLLIDHAILMALRCAHERYPYFELDNAEKVLNGLKDSSMPELLDYYKGQKKRAGQLVDYYNVGGYKSDDRFFEEAYTDFAASGILQYIGDVLELLVESNVVSAAEADEYLALMRSY